MQNHAEYHPSAASIGPRIDLYADIHKALRAAMCETLMRVGRTDATDAEEIRTTLSVVRELLAMCRSHVDKENRHVHPAIDARARGVSARIALEHDEHLQAIADLEEDVQVVEVTAVGSRDAALMRLYRHLSLFVADNFEHMIIEETSHNAALWAHYSDAQLMEIHQRILASIPPAEMTAVLRWMVPSVDATSRARMFAGMRAQLPPEAFDGVLALAKSHLGPREAAKLERSLREMPA